MTTEINPLTNEINIELLGYQVRQMKDAFGAFVTEVSKRVIIDGEEIDVMLNDNENYAECHKVMIAFHNWKVQNGHK